MAKIFVTGASSGLGLLTAVTLAEQGHDVVMHARSPDRAPKHRVLVEMLGIVYADLGDLDATKNLAEQANSFGAFDVIIHNAGTSDSESMVAVNVIAPYILGALMLAPQRVIYLSSSLHRSGSSDLDRLGSASRDVTYADTKLYVTALAMALATANPPQLIHAVDPGWVPTKMGGPDATDDLDMGHHTQEWLATAPAHAIDPHTAGYWFHGERQEPHELTTDRMFQQGLIARLGELTDITL